MTDSHPPLPAPPPPESNDQTVAEALLMDEMGAASFPASDPPATWTWEVNATPGG